MFGLLGAIIGGIAAGPVGIIAGGLIDGALSEGDGNSSGSPHRCYLCNKQYKKYNVVSTKSGISRETVCEACCMGKGYKILGQIEIE